MFANITSPINLKSLQSTVKTDILSVMFNVAKVIVMDIGETNNSASQSNQPENLVFRLSPELALQLIEHMKDTICDDDDLLETPRNIR